MDKYSREVISPEFGEGRVKEKITSGLENILNDVFEKDIFPENQDVEKKYIEDFKDIDKEINLNEIDVRTYNCLRSQGIETYRDIIEASMKPERYFSPMRYYEMEETGALGRWNKKLDSLDGKEYYSKVMKKGWRNMGDKSINILFEHLDNIGFNYGKDYAQQVISKD